MNDISTEVEYMRYCYKKAGELMLTKYRHNRFPPLAALNNDSAAVRLGACIIIRKMLDLNIPVPEYTFAVLEDHVASEPQMMIRVALKEIISHWKKHLK